MGGTNSPEFFVSRMPSCVPISRTRAHAFKSSLETTISARETRMNVFVKVFAISVLDQLLFRQKEKINSLKIYFIASMIRSVGYLHRGNE